MLVGVDDLRQYMSGLNMTADQTFAAGTVLAGIQSDLEMFLGRTIEPIQVREAKRTDVRGWWNPTYTPVLKVIQITKFGWSRDPQQYFDDVTLNPMTPDSIVTRPVLDWTGESITTPVFEAGGFHIGYPNAWYAIEYVAGYRGPLLDSMKLAILRVAAREFANHSDDTVGVRGDQAENASKQDNRPTGWTDDELKRFLGAKRRVII